MHKNPSRNKPPSLALQPSLVQDNIPCEIVPKLWIGSIHAAFNFEAIKEKKITHVLNVSGNVATYPQDFTYLTVDLRDKDYTNLLSCIPTAIVFLECGIQHGGVLVHCAGGRSRSPAIVIAYIMSTLGLSYEDALNKVRAARPVVSLNTGFEDQLRYFEKAKRDIYLAHQMHLQSKIVRARLRRGQNLPHEIEHAPKKQETRMLMGTIPFGFYLTRPTSPKDQQYIPPLRTMGNQYGCSACGTLLYCSGNILKHNESTDAALWTIAVDRKRAISCPETPRGHNIPIRPFNENGDSFDDDDDDTQSANASVVPVTIVDDDNDAVMTEAIREFAMDDDEKYQISTISTTKSTITTVTKSSSSSIQVSDTKIQQSKKMWHSLTSFRQFSFRKDSFKGNKSTGDDEMELMTWRQHMKALEKHGSRHQIRRVSAAMSDDEKQFLGLHSRLCDCIYVEPLKWFGKMQATCGSIKCPKDGCTALVGQWNWDEVHKCACGGLLSPSFIINKNAVKQLIAKVPATSKSSEKELT